jgi:hypothetical protein
MPSGPIQTIPQGLLGLLQLKELGKNPSELLDQVQPSYDLFQQYIQRNLVGEQTLIGGPISTAALVTANRGLQGFSLNGAGVTFLNVPQNQIWYVYQLSGDVLTINPADTISYSMACLLPSGRFCALSPPYLDVQNARTRAGLSGVVTPFWASPGTGFAVWVYDILAATTITVLGTIRAVQIQI